MLSALCGCALYPAAPESESLVAAYAPYDQASGVNPHAIADYATYSGRIFKAKFTAVRSSVYLADYTGMGDTHLAVELRDWQGKTALMAYISRSAADGEALAELLADGKAHKVTLRLKLPLDLTPYLPEEEAPPAEEPSSLPAEPESAPVSEPLPPESGESGSAPTDEELLEELPPDYEMGEQTDLDAPQIVPTAARRTVSPTGGVHTRALAADAAVPDAVFPAPARIVQLVSAGWGDPEEHYAALFEAVDTASPDDVRALMRAGAAVDAIDANGDGLLFHALNAGNITMATVLVSAGVSTANRNFYHTGCDLLTGFERADLLTTVEQIQIDGGAVGCDSESMLGYFVAAGRDEPAAFLLSLNSFDPNAYSLSQCDSAALAERYGVALPENAFANVLDLAVAAGDTAMVSQLLNAGIQPSALLLSKIAQKMDFPQSMLELLGARRFFGVLDEVITDFHKFHASYAAVEGRLMLYYEKVEEYDQLLAAGDVFQANYLLSNEIATAAEAQSQALAELYEPKSAEIGALYALAEQYSAACDSAVHQLRLINRAITKQARQIHYARFNYFQREADSLKAELDDAIAYYLKISALVQ